MKLYGKRCILMLLTLCAAAFCLPAFAMASELPDEVVPLGIVTGIEIETDGVIVTGFSGEHSAAKEAGIEIGDMIVKLDEYEISSGSDLRFACAHLGSEPARITVNRGDRQLDVTVYPAKGAEGKYELGLMVRDGLTGIGTMTFLEPGTGLFGALGHGVTESESGLQIPLRAGSISRAVITGIIKGASGNPGRIMGLTDSQRYSGSVDINTKFGIFGIADYEAISGAEPMKIAEPEEIHTGKAFILSDIGGTGVEQYEVEIIRLFGQNQEGRNMSIKVTDEELLKMTGGIIQGMSGSPIIQDGKLAGAVTHVLVGDPTKGYGIYISNMLDAAA